MADKHAHVICCNDSVQHVVIGTEEQAQAELENLRHEHLERTRGQIPLVRSMDGSRVIWGHERVYQDRYYWRVRTVDLTVHETPGGPHADV